MENLPGLDGKGIRRHARKGHANRVDQRIGFDIETNTVGGQGVSQADRLLVLELIANGADQFLDHILQGHQASLDLADQHGPTVALGGQLRDPRGSNLHDGEFRQHEERVQRQQKDQGKPQDRWLQLTSPMQASFVGLTATKLIDAVIISTEQAAGDLPDTLGSAEDHDDFGISICAIRRDVV